MSAYSLVYNLGLIGSSPSLSQIIYICILLITGLRKMLTFTNSNISCMVLVCPAIFMDTVE